MLPASRVFASSVLFLFLGCLSGCGSSKPEPSHPDEAAARDRAAKAEAEKARAARMARLDSSDLAEKPLESVAKVQLEPLVVGVRPGRKFLLAAHFKIAPGYRISWTNPGGVGKETVVAVRGPSGFEVGEPRFAVPERYTVPGGYVGYGYQDETVVFVEVKAPGALPRSGVHRFDLSASWVACKKECATEHTDAFIELETTYGSAAAKDVESSLAPFKARLPTPLADVKGAEQKWEHSGSRSTLVVSIPGAELREFWSGAVADPAPKKVDVAGDHVRFVFGEKPGPDAKPIRGLVVASSGGKDAFYELEAASPDGEKEAAEPAHAKGAAGRRKRR